MQRQRKTVLALAITLVIVTLPYWEVLIGHRTAMYGDVNDFHVPIYVTVWRTIRAGHLPWWTQNVFAGHSMLGAAQYAVFYPFNAIFGWLDPVTAYRWWMLGHIWLAAAGAFAWAWYRWQSRPGAIVAGVAYALNGFAVLHLVHASFVAAVAWLPFVFLGVDLVSKRWTRPRAALVAIPIALIAFLGQPQLLWMAMGGSALYIVALVLAGGRTWKGAARVAGAMACGVGIAAVQLLPLFDFSRTSVRPSLSMAASFDQSITPHHLLLLGFPYLFGGSSHPPSFAAPWFDAGIQQEVGNYLGITILAIGVIGVIALRRNRVVRALLAMSFAALLIGMGGSTVVGRLVYDLVPGAREFRDWGRMLWIANLGVAMLAAVGMREVLRAPRKLVRPIVTCAGLLVIFVVIVLPNIGSVDKVLATGRAGTIAQWMPILLLLALAGAIAIASLHRKAGIVAIILVCAVDMVSFAYAAPWNGQSLTVAEAHTFYNSSPPDFGTPFDAAGGVDRWASDSYGFRSISLAKNLLGINGYDPLMQKDWAQTAGDWLYDGFPTNGDLWSTGWTSDVLRVSTLILSNSVTPAAHTGWKRVGPVPDIGFTRWVRTPRLPDAYLVGAVDLAPLAEIQSQLVDPNARLRGSAYVEHRTPQLTDLDQPGSAGTVANDDLLGSKVVVDAQRDALLVLSEDWEAGWHATVDGKSVPVLRTDGLVLGIPVPRGHHVVRIAFSPPGLHEGVLITLLAVLALFFAAPLIALGVPYARRWRRWQTVDPEPAPRTRTPRAGGL